MSNFASWNSIIPPTDALYNNLLLVMTNHESSLPSLVSFQRNLKHESSFTVNCVLFYLYSRSFSARSLYYQQFKKNQMLVYVLANQKYLAGQTVLLINSLHWLFSCQNNLYCLKTVVFDADETHKKCQKSREQAFSNY